LLNFAALRNNLIGVFQATNQFNEHRAHPKLAPGQWRWLSAAELVAIGYKG
jgi:hypothetical protein